MGANALSTAELMAIILRTGTPEENVVRLAQRLLQESAGWQGWRRHHTESDTVQGVGRQGHRTARRL